MAERRGSTSGHPCGRACTHSRASCASRTSAISRSWAPRAAPPATATCAPCRRCTRSPRSRWAGASTATCSATSRATAPCVTTEARQMDRRRFLTVLGATGGAAAAVSACDIHPEPTEHLVPYTVPPENQVPGIATYYATTCRECAAGCGLHAKVREGRVVKLEGNPESPINQGRLCSRGQAGLQGLYNPDRVTDPMARGPSGEWQKLSWEEGVGRLQAKVKEAHGKGIAFVTGLESGSFGELVDAWTRQVGGRHVTYEPFAFQALRAGNRIAFGTPAIPWYDFANARYIVSFGADFMETWLSPVGYQNSFTRAHAFTGGRDASMAKFVYVGPRLPLTGMSADEWIAAAPGTEGMLALAMAHVIVARRLAPLPADVGRVRAALDAHAPERVAAAVGIEAPALAPLARELAASRGGLAVTGRPA